MESDEKIDGCIAMVRLICSLQSDQRENCKYYQKEVSQFGYVHCGRYSRDGICSPPIGVMAEKLFKHRDGIRREAKIDMMEELRRRREAGKQSR